MSEERSEDPRDAAARYRLEQLRRHDPDAFGEADATPRTMPGVPNRIQRAAYVESAIQQAIRRGEFDDLPGAGRPIPGLGDHHDPDWWIRRKIQTEQLTGLGPPALMLRVEHTEFEERIDVLGRESDVRDYIEDFNRRVVDARRQLLGGPPVVTPTREVEAEVAAWRERRETRIAADAVEDEPARPRRGLFRRSRR
jgi:hypothetical protein